VATVETSASGAAVLEGATAHSNHYLDPALSGSAPPPSAGSVSRLARIQALLEDGRPAGPESAMEVLSDHEGPESVCLHPDADDGDEASATLFAMVCHLEERRMWVAAGNPCRVAFEEIDLGEVA
jgi:isopenicillin-N N-acyltransferase-like protein